jgi:hypothetical protein
MTNEEDCVEVGSACADVWAALHQGWTGSYWKTLTILSAKQLNGWRGKRNRWWFVRNTSLMHTLDRSKLVEIQRKISKKSKRNLVFRLFYAKIDREAIVTWKADLSGGIYESENDVFLNFDCVWGWTERDTPERAERPGKAEELEVKPMLMDHDQFAPATIF